MKWHLDERERQREIWFLEQCDELGLDIRRFSSKPRKYSDSLKRDEKIAFRYLAAGKQVPGDIRKRLIESKAIRVPEPKESIEIDPHLFDEEVRKITKI